MKEVIKELIEYYKEKNCTIIYNEKEDNIEFTINVKINRKLYTEDLTIKKTFISEIHKEFIKNGINYNLHNAYDKYLRGE